MSREQCCNYKFEDYCGTEEYSDEMSKLYANVPHYPEGHNIIIVVGKPNPNVFKPKNYLEFQKNFVSKFNLARKISMDTINFNYQQQLYSLDMNKACIKILKDKFLPRITKLYVKIYSYDEDFDTDQQTNLIYNINFDDYDPNLRASAYHEGGLGATDPLLLFNYYPVIFITTLNSNITIEEIDLDTDKKYVYNINFFYYLTQISLFGDGRPQYQIPQSQKFLRLVLNPDEIKNLKDNINEVFKYVKKNINPDLPQGENRKLNYNYTVDIIRTSYEIKFNFSIDRDDYDKTDTAIKTENFLSSGIVLIDFTNNYNFRVNSYFNKSLTFHRFCYFLLAHEFCHFLGLPHTMQLQKDNPIQSRDDWIIDKLLKLYSSAEDGIIKKVDVETFDDDLGAKDRQSIMQYDVPRCTNKPGWSWGRCFDLSENDIRIIKYFYLRNVSEEYHYPYRFKNNNMVYILVIFIIILFILVILLL